jgi:hypothetical protein
MVVILRGCGSDDRFLKCHATFVQRQTYYWSRTTEREFQIREHPAQSSNITATRQHKVATAIGEGSLVPHSECGR